MEYYRDDEFSPTLADTDYSADDTDGDDPLVPVDDDDDTKEEDDSVNDDGGDDEEL